MGEVTPFYRDDWLTVWHGDCREVMASLPAESVHCVVTSPPLGPYWGLRDYGTATWEGGEAGCEHTALRRPGEGDKSFTNGGTSRDKPTNVCRTCGATRIDSQLGLEPTPEEYVANLVAVFREVRRVLRKDGTVWLNLGDSYAGSMRGSFKSDIAWDDFQDRAKSTGYSPGVRARTPYAKHGMDVPGLKPKDLVGIPWRVAFALQADGWYLRSDIIWSKPNPMPESVTDRPTKSHEYLFLLAKSARYYFDADAVREGATNGERFHGARLDDSIVQSRTTSRNGRDSDDNRISARNIRSVWTVATAPYPGAHFATFPPKLIEPCIKAGCPEGGTVLDPFAGSGTTGMVAQSLSRRAVLIDLSLDYLGQLMGRNADIPLGLGA